MEQKYILVENKTSVLWGPMFWNRYRTFQTELDDLDVNFTLSPTETGYVLINDNYEIFPVVETTGPTTYDPTYDQLVGPFYTFSNNEAFEQYQSQPIAIENVRQTLTQVAATERFRKEQLGTTATVQDVIVTVDTSRDGRNVFVQKYALMADSDTVNWKFPEQWITLTKADLGSVVYAGAAYIQAQFDWEQQIGVSIDAATTPDELKAIVIVQPPVMPTIPGA